MPDGTDQMPWELYANSQAAQKPWDLYANKQAATDVAAEDSSSSEPDAPKPQNPLGIDAILAKQKSDSDQAAKDFSFSQGAENLGADVLNLPARAYRAVAGTPRVAVGGYDEQGRPTIGEADAPLPFQPGKSLYQPQGTAMEPGGNDAQKLISGLLTPGNIAAFPFARSKIVQQAFLTQTVPAAVQAAEKLVTNFNNPDERRSAALDLVASTIMSHGLAHEAFKGGESDASRISTPAEVHGDLQPSPVPGEGQVPAQEGGPGVQPQPAEAPQAKVPLGPGVAREWGTRNQWFAKNPYRDQLTEMQRTGNIDSGVIEDSDRWELNQVLKDKPAYLSGGVLPESELKSFADEHGLHFGRDSSGSAVVAKTKAGLDAVLNAKDQRGLGLALGYEDIRPINEAMDYSPEDLQKYQSMKAKSVPKSAEEFSSPEFQQNWKDLEALRNKYNGMPPKQLLKSPTTETGAENTKNGEGVGSAPPQSSIKFRVERDHETGESHIVNDKDEIVATYEQNSHAHTDAAKLNMFAEGRSPVREVDKPFLDEDDQKHFDAERKNLGVDVELTDDANTTHPFAKNAMAWADRDTGKIFVNKDALKEFVERLPKNRRATAIRSVLAEERIHMATDDAAAKTYWSNLSPWEQAILKRRYTGGVPHEMNDINWGHEALRYRIQQLARMTPTEVAMAVGKEKWTLKALTIAEHAIRGARSVINFKSSRESNAILKRIQSNIDLAKQQIRSGYPAAFRGRPKIRPVPKEQQDFELPGMESQRLAGSKIAASNVPGKEGQELPQTPEEVKAAQDAALAKKLPQRPTANEFQAIGDAALKKDVADRVEQAKEGKNVRLPSIKDFAAELKKRWSNVKPGEISDLWSGAVGKFINTASGEDLRLLGKSAFGGNVREILSDKELNERFKGNPKAAVEYAKRQEKALIRESGKGSSIWNAPVVDAGYGTEEFNKHALTDAEDKYPGVGIDALDLHWVDNRAAAEFERRTKLFNEGKLETAPNLEKIKTSELRDLAEGKRTASRQYQLERTLAKAREKRQIQSAKRRRAWIASAIFRKMVKPEVADSEGILNRKGVTPDDVRPSNDGKYSSYQDLSDFPQSKIADALSDKARRSSSDSATVTRRLAVLENKRTGEVHLVSAYDHPHGPDVPNDVRVLDPLSPTRTHVPLESILGRYNALRSVFLDQPVRKFRQDFKDLDEFNDKFGDQVEADVKNAAGYSPDTLSPSEFAQEAGGRISEGSGGSFQGPHRDLVSEPSQGAAELSATTPITPQEERSLVDYVNQFGRPRNPTDVMRAIQEMSVKRPNAAVISALRKISAGFQKHFPDYDEDAILKALSRAIYDKTIPTGRALKEGGQPKAANPGKDAGSAAQAVNQSPGDQAQAAKRGPAPGGNVSPAAFFNRRKLEEKREQTMAHLNVVKNQAANVFKRQNTAAHMASTIDGMDTVANNMGQNAEWSVRMESADEANKKFGIKPNFRGKKDILESAPAVLAAKGIKVIYHYDNRALAEKARLLREDPVFVGIVHSMKNLMTSEVHSAADIKTAQESLGVAIQSRLRKDGFLHAKDARYLRDTGARANIDFLMTQLKAGSEQAQRMKDRGNVWDKYRGSRWLASNKKLMRTLEYAKAQWDNPELINTARRARMEMDRQYDVERDNGYSINHDPDYMPGRYDGETWSPAGVLFGGKKVLGRQFRAAAVFDNQYHAASVGPYIPASLDVASLVGSRVRQGMRSVARRMWWDSLKELRDESGRSVAKEGKLTGGAPSPEYHQFEMPGGKKVYVLEDYDGLVHQLVDPSALQHWAPSRLALQAGQYLKHTVLAGDVFHFGRVLYYGASIMGKNGKFKPGWAATAIREEDLDRAVKSGVISASTRDYLKEKVPFRIGPKADMISRSRLSELYERSGLNTGQIQDAIYKDLARKVPGFGAYNRFLFDRFTTGMMKTAALQEFDRLTKLDPEKDSRQIVQESAKALNLYFGSIGRQGWIRSATMRDLSRMALLAPQWLEGLVKKEVQPLKLLTSPRMALTGRDTAFRGIGRGMVSMLVLTQVINLINRGTPTWNNPEKDHKWDAYLGGNLWLSPLAVFNELTADLVRLNGTKQRAWDVVQQIGQNKLGFYGRVASVLYTGKSPSGEYQSTTAGVLKTAAEQLIPTPISFGTAGQAIGHKIAPNAVPPVPPGQLTQKIFSTMGVKTHLGLDPVQKMNQEASQFKQAHGIQEPKIEFTDEPAASKLRYQLKIGDEAGAAKTLNALRKTHTDGQILDAMEKWARRPFTSAENESLFVGGMDDAGRQVYWQAMQQRYNEVNNFMYWYSTQPNH